MNKKTLFFAFCFLARVAVAQQVADPVLLTVAGEDITRSEFERVYNKNNTKENKNDPAAIREYLELFINYKLKVKEAEEEKLDTLSSFVSELAGYRKQLAQPYLTDKNVTEHLVEEAYERMKTDVHASHILVKVSPDALPADTLEAYTRAALARQYIMKKPVSTAQLENYGKMVDKAFPDPDQREQRMSSMRQLVTTRPASGQDPFEVAARLLSDDPSVKDNAGDLGFFSGMMMVYPFENAAYATRPGTVSEPVRTKYGYHLILVHSKRPAAGEMRAAHIMIKSAPGDPDSVKQAARKRIDEVYAKLKGGEKFEDLAAQYSDDKGSAKNGGVLPWFGTGRMVPEFEAAAFALEADGDYSAPVKTNYGWHIVKRLEKRGLPPFEEKKTELKNQISRDSRSEMSKTSMIHKIKKEYGFREITKNKDDLIRALDTNVVNGDWSAESVSTFTKPLFTLGDKTWTQQDFAEYIASHQSRRPGSTPQAVGYQLYDAFVDERCLGYEEAHLDEKYPDFKSLMREYRDGILLFDLTDRKVWSMAVKDTAGLEAFYNANKTKYMWGDRVKATIYTCADAKVSSKVRKLIRKGKTDEEIEKELNTSSALNVTVRSGVYARGDNEMIDSVQWVAGMTPDGPYYTQVVFVNIREVMPPQPKSLDEARGLVTADYQNQLEKEWIGQLRRKYTVKVNEEVLRTVGKD